MMAKYDLTRLYDSRRCRLTGITVSGRKNTAGVLHFNGLYTSLGDSKVVRALESGYVVYARRDLNIHSRSHRRGIVVTIQSQNRVCISYERLSERLCNVGDYINAGDIIGYEGDTGPGKEKYLTLRFERNGRLIDGCEYLGIERKPAEFGIKGGDVREAVAEGFGLTPRERQYIDEFPYSDELWIKLYMHGGRGV